MKPAASSIYWAAKFTVAPRSSLLGNAASHRKSLVTSAT